MPSLEALDESPSEKRHKDLITFSITQKSDLDEFFQTMKNMLLHS